MAVIAQGELKVSRTPDVRFGSKADITRRLIHVRFALLYAAINSDDPYGWAWRAWRFRR
jgi:hypothetical protein